MQAATGHAASAADEAFKNSRRFSSIDVLPFVMREDVSDRLVAVSPEAGKVTER